MNQFDRKYVNKYSKESRKKGFFFSGQSIKRGGGWGGRRG